MAAIDSWVIRQAIGLIARAPGELRLAVNVSGASMGDETVLALIEKPFATGAIDPASLVFEVTETAAIVNIEQANRFATRLNELGCAFALDDFGAGFGSFYYLKHVPFEYLKIDGEFIQNMPDSRTDQLTVRAIAEMAHGLGKWTVAEFVEDERTLELLREYGVDYAQGYHLGRPRPVKDGFAASAARVSRRPGHLLTIGPEP